MNNGDASSRDQHFGGTLCPWVRCLSLGDAASLIFGPVRTLPLKGLKDVLIDAFVAVMVFLDDSLETTIPCFSFLLCSALPFTNETLVRYPLTCVSANSLPKLNRLDLKRDG